LTHPFYLVDDRAVSLLPAVGGYDLMKAAHLVLDVPNGLAWSRLTQSPLEPQALSPNPSAAQLPSSEVGPSVSFVRELCRAADASAVTVSGRSSAENVVVSGLSSVEDVVVSASSSVPSELLSSESVSRDNSSSVLSRQVSVVLPASHYSRISTASSHLDPRDPPIQPRWRSGTWKEPYPLPQCLQYYRLSSLQATFFLRRV